MIDLKAKELYVSLVEHVISRYVIDSSYCSNKGYRDSLADVLEKTKAGVYDWCFDDSYVYTGDEPDIMLDFQRWKDIKKQNEKNFKKIVKLMTEDDFALCKDGYFSSDRYIYDRAEGYFLAAQMMSMITD